MTAAPTSRAGAAFRDAAAARDWDRPGSSELPVHGFDFADELRGDVIRTGPNWWLIGCLAVSAGCWAALIAAAMWGAR